MLELIICRIHFILSRLRCCQLTDEQLCYMSSNPAVANSVLGEGSYLVMLNEDDLEN